jgi:hypothetical protein
MGDDGRNKQTIVEREDHCRTSATRQSQDHCRSPCLPKRTGKDCHCGEPASKDGALHRGLCQPTHLLPITRGPLSITNIRHDTTQGRTIVVSFNHRSSKIEGQSFRSLSTEIMRPEVHRLEGTRNGQPSRGGSCKSQ